MAILTPQILGRNLDAEGRASIVNVAKITLANAATEANDVVRFTEYNTAVSDLNTRVNAIEAGEGYIDQVYVDTTSTDLATAIAAATWDGVNKTWTFGGSKVLTTGDVLILNAATQQDSDRTWILNGTNGGTAADFTALGSDIDAAINAAVAAVVGDAANQFNTLGKIEDYVVPLNDRVVTAESEIDALQAGQALRPELRTFSGTFGSADLDGVYTATIPHTFGSSKLHVELQNETAVAGTWTYVDSTLGFTMDVSNTNIVVKTESPTLAALAVRVVATGVVGL